MNTGSESKTRSALRGFLPETLEAFRISLDDCLDPDEPGMKSCAPFARVLLDAKVILDEEAKQLPEGRPQRSAVFELAAAEACSVSVATVSAAAMAWGGMNLRWWKRLWDSGNREWLGVAQRIRDGCLKRREAYEELDSLKKSKKLPGMGPAFFTKPIYFLSPRDDTQCKPAYIMDQWAGSSVNLLTDKNQVLLDGTRTWKRSADERLDVSYSFTVSDKNTCEDYEKFCAIVDRIAGEFCLCVDQVDQALFSSGRPKLGTWRKYVEARGQTLLDAMHRIGSVRTDSARAE